MINNSKKILALLLVAIGCFLVVGCGSDKKTTTTTTTTVTTKNPAELNEASTIKRVAVSSDIYEEDEGVYSDRYGMTTFSTINAAIEYIQAQIDAGKMTNEEEKAIFLMYGAPKSYGVYKEKVTIDIPNLSLIGSNDEVIISYGDYASLNGMGTDKTATVTITSKAVNFKASNITFVNSFDYIANKDKSDIQALAVNCQADQSTFYNCTFKGYQDTLEAKNGRQYYYDCTIEGCVDFIFWADAVAYFDNCIIRSLDRKNSNQGYICAPKGGADDMSKLLDYGFIFNNCSLLFDEDSDINLYAGTVKLARPWRQGAYTAYVNCFMDKHIDSAYADMSGNTAANARFYEYGNYGPGAIENRTDKKDMNAEQAAKATDLATVFGTTNGDYTFETAFDAKAAIKFLATTSYVLVNNTKDTTIRVQEDYAGLNLPYDLNTIVTNIDLPTRGLNGTTIEWTSSNPAVLNTQGIINRPAYEEADANVTLTAKVTYREVSMTKTFNVVVPKHNKTIIITKIDENFDYEIGKDLSSASKWVVAGIGKLSEIVDNVPYNNDAGDATKAVKFVQSNGGEASYTRSINIDGEMAIEFFALQSQDGANIKYSLLNENSEEMFFIKFNAKDANGKRLVSVNGVNTTLDVLEGVWYKYRVTFNQEAGTFTFGYYDYQANAYVEVKNDKYINEFNIKYMRFTSDQGKIAEDSAFYLADMYVDKVSEFAGEVGTNPNKEYGIGIVEGIKDRVIQNQGEEYVHAEIKVYNRFTLQLLTLGTDYTIEYTGLDGVDVNNEGRYTTYVTITLNDGEQLVFTEIVDVQPADKAIELTNYKQGVILAGKATFSVTASRDDGKLYYMFTKKTDVQPTIDDVIAQNSIWVDSSWNSAEPVGKGVINLANGMDIEITQDFADSTIEYLLYIVAVKNDNTRSNVITSDPINDKFMAKTADDLINVLVDPASIDAKIYLANDIDFTGIGYAGTTIKFKGIIDGQGYTIKNLTADFALSKVGLLAGVLTGGTVRNINFENITINAMGGYNGIIAGEAENGTISNVKINGFKFTSSGQYNGGIVGRLNNSTGTLNISNTSIVGADFKFSTKYGGGIMAGIENGTLNLDNVLFAGSVSCPEATSTILGRLKAGKVIMNNVAVFGTINDVKKQAGAFIGFVDGSTDATISNSVANIKINGVDSISSSNAGTFGNITGTGNGGVAESNLANIHIIDYTLPGAAITDGSADQKGIIQPKSSVDFTTADGYTTAGFDMTTEWVFDAETKEIRLA